MGKYLIIVPLLVGFWKPITITERTYRPEVLSDIIYASFGDHSKAITAIFKAESGLNPNAVNWNCSYHGKGKPCKPEDRPKAFAVDCGIAQVSVRAKECPKELFDMERNVSEAREIFDRQGFNAWTTFRTGAYKRFL